MPGTSVNRQREREMSAMQHSWLRSQDVARRVAQKLRGRGISVKRSRYLCDCAWLVGTLSFLAAAY